MDNKLQELTRKLYDEGLEKGRGEAEKLVEDAKKHAAKLVDEAQKKAEKIRAEAREEADDLRRNTMTELAMAGEQAISKLKATIRDMVVARALSGFTGVLSPEFIKTLLEKAVAGWNDGEVTVVMPEGYVPPSEGFEVEFSRGVKSGFRLASQDGGYYVDFSGEALEALLKDYLRPRVEEILFKK